MFWPTSGQFDRHGNSLGLELVGGTHARQHQHLGGGDGSGAEDYLAALDHEGLVAALHLDANGTLTSGALLQHNAVDLDVGANGQVEAVANQVDVGQGHAHAHAVDVVLGAQADSGGLGVVHIGVEGIPGGGGGLEERLLGSGPSLAMVMADRHRAIGAVEVIVEVGVVFQLAEVGQAVDVGPAVVAP